MNRLVIAGLATMSAIAALSFRIGVAVGEQTPPSANKGVSASQAAAIDVSHEIADLEGRQLRLRLVTIEPGGVIALHSHKDRPAVAYVVQGTLVEHRNGKPEAHHTGEGWSEGGDVTHWAENPSDKAVTVLTADLYKP